MRNEVFLWLTLTKSLQSTSREVIEFLLKDFVFEQMFMSFPNFLLWTVYPGTIYSNKL